MVLGLFSGRKTRIVGFTAGAAAVALAVAGCGASGGGASAGSAPKQFTFLSITENPTIKSVLGSLGNGSCAAPQKALPLKVDNVPQANLDQKLQLLAGQNALPVQFAAGNAPALTDQLYKAGQVEDLGTQLQKLGAYKNLQPAAISTIKALYKGKIAVLPYEYNIEGIFYNKKLFAAQHLSPPTTWDDMVADAAKFKAAGVQPFSASGQQGWPLTRLIGDYLFRTLGPSAMQDVADGKAKLTDPKYVAAAKAVADLGKKGYFGQGVGSVDYDSSFNTFLTGKAAMFYMGSWTLTTIADPTMDKIGAQNIGFTPFPAVSGGKGSIDQYPSNVGLPMTISAKSYSPQVGSWVKCIAQNYGSAALKEHGQITGFKTNTPVPSKNAVSDQIQQTIAKSTQNVLWFEALFSTQATNVSQTNAGPLVSGALSPQEFMAKVQAALDASQN